MRKGIASVEALISGLAGVSLRAGHVKQEPTGARQRSRKRSKRKMEKASRRANR